MNIKTFNSFLILNEGFFSSMYKSNNDQNQNDLAKEILNYLNNQSTTYGDQIVYSPSRDIYSFMMKFKSGGDYKIDVMRHIDFRTTNQPEYTIVINKYNKEEIKNIETHAVEQPIKEIDKDKEKPIEIPPIPINLRSINRNTKKMKNKKRIGPNESIIYNYEDFIIEEIRFGGHGTPNNPNLSGVNTKNSNGYDTHSIDNKKGEVLKCDVSIAKQIFNKSEQLNKLTKRTISGDARGGSNKPI